MAASSSQRHPEATITRTALHHYQGRNSSKEGLQTLLADVVVDMLEQGEDVAEPLSGRRYSGKFKLRLGERLHREVALHAAEENLSSNQWVVRKLMADG